MSMLEYNKLILQKVSFNEEIFEKELSKAISGLMPHQRFDFIAWCSLKFSNLHYRVLRKFVRKSFRKSFFSIKRPEIQDNK
jgi:hypothetical protein